MSEIRDKVLRTKALKDMDLNAEIIDYDCELNYKFYWEGKVKSGFSNIYTDMYGEWDIDEDKAIECINKGDLIKQIIKQKHIKDKKINELRKYKNISHKVYIKAKIYYKLSYVDGETRWVSKIVTLDENNYHAPLLNSLKNNMNSVHAEITDDNIMIKFDDNNETIVSNDNKPTKNMEPMAEFVIEYLSHPTKWVSAKTGQIIENEDSISIPIFINNTSINLKFSNPQDNKSDVWKFSDEFGYNDPWNLQNEDAQISFNPQSNTNYKRGFWNIRKPVRTTRTFSEIKSKISKIIT